MTSIQYDTFNALKARMKAKFPVLLQGYLKDSQSYLSTIESAIPANDLQALIGAAHSLKSASGLLGITQVHKAAETLEYAGKELADQTPATCESLLPHYEVLHGYVLDVQDELHSELNQADD